MKILIAGCGSIGSNLAVDLACDVRDQHEITLVDNGFVEERNVRVGNQQYFINQVGAAKVDALQFNLYRLWSRNATILHAKLSQETARNIISPFGLVIDCLDNIEARSVTTEACRTFSTPCIHIGFSPKMTFSILWDEGYVPPEDAPQGFDVCELEGAASFIRLVASLGSLTIQEFLKTGKKKEFTGNKFIIREVI